MKQPKVTSLGSGIMRLRGPAKGPRIGIICNMHGNEPCGRYAVRRVLANHELERGDLVIIDGNPDASLLYRRFIDGDMNRMFTARKLASKSRKHDLLRARYLAETLPALGLDLAVDFHSVSSPTAHPFVISFPGTEALAALCPMPRIYGWRGIVKGTLCEWLCDHGTPTVVVEAGLHEAASSVRIAERTILSVLSDNAMITLDRPVSGLRKPGFDVIENVQIKDLATFELTREYGSFDTLRPGEKIASDSQRDYIVPDEEGLVILMPTTMEAVRNGTSAGAYYLMRRRPHG